MIDTFDFLLGNPRLPERLRTSSGPALGPPWPSHNASKPPGFLLRSPPLYVVRIDPAARCYPSRRPAHPSHLEDQIVAIETRRHDRALVIRTDHRLDGVNAPTFHDRLDAATVSAERAVVNGMGELTYISNAGLRVMPQTIRKTQERGARLALCSRSDDVRAVFETGGFDRLIGIHPSPDEAIAAVLDQSTVAHAAAVEDDDGNHRRSASQRQND